MSKMYNTEDCTTSMANHSESSMYTQKYSSQDIPEWSVIVITRNEESVIETCLTSVIEAFSGTSYELILVDSASTDRTVDIAQTFPVRIIRLPNTIPLRPSVGRHIGFIQSRGQWILFLDGDMVLVPEWVKYATSAFREQPRLAGVAGELVHVFTSDSSEQTTIKEPYSTLDYDQPRHLSGSAAYKREALQQTGGFNPFLYSGEEAELGARLRKAGYAVQRLRTAMTKHFPKYPRESVPELFRRIHRGYFIGLGQFYRHSSKYNLPTKKWLFPMFIRYVEFLALLFLGLLAIIAYSGNGQWLPFAGWAAIMTVLFLIFTFKSRSIRKPAYYFLRWALASPFVVWGFLKTPKNANEFDSILDNIVTINIDSSNIPDPE